MEAVVQIIEHLCAFCIGEVQRQPVKHDQWSRRMFKLYKGIRSDVELEAVQSKLLGLVLVLY